MMLQTVQNLARNLLDTPSALNTLPPPQTQLQNSTVPLIQSRMKVVLTLNCHQTGLEPAVSPS